MSRRSYADIVADTFLRLFVLLQTPDLQRLAMVNRAAYVAYVLNLHVLFDVDTLLASFFREPAGFRQLQLRTGLIISGSQALQFLGRRSYGVCDLDLYVDQYSAYVVVDWLRWQGYKFVTPQFPVTKSECTFVSKELRQLVALSGIYARRGEVVFKFRREDEADRIDCVDLIVSMENPFASLCSFHSTCVMNFVSANFAVSLFPRGTFVDNMSLVLKQDNFMRAKAVHDKYAARGFKMVRDTSLSLAFTPGERWMLDSLVFRDRELLRGEADEGLIRARAPWIVPLRSLPELDVNDTFWSTRSYNLERFRSACARPEETLLYRTGWSLQEEINVTVAATEPLYYGSQYSFCVPPAFDVFFNERIGSAIGSQEANNLRLKQLISLYRLHSEWR